MPHKTTSSIIFFLFAFTFIFADTEGLQFWDYPTEPDQTIGVTVGAEGSATFYIQLVTVQHNQLDSLDYSTVEYDGDYVWAGEWCEPAQLYYGSGSLTVEVNDNPSNQDKWSYWLEAYWGSNYDYINYYFEVD